MEVELHLGIRSHGCLNRDRNLVTINRAALVSDIQHTLVATTGVNRSVLVCFSVETSGGSQRQEQEDGLF